MENAKEVARYLAEEISKSDYMDIKSLESKIYAALVVMAPPSPSKGEEIFNLQGKLGEVKKRHREVNSQLIQEVKFWKNKTKTFLDDWQMQESYKELDEILEAYGYKIKG